MHIAGRPPALAHLFRCWNWKCALLSATARSLVYLAAMAHSGLRGSLPIVLVELIYVTLTAGLYAAMQQRALDFGSKLLGNLTIALGVPGLAQVLDWITHRAAGAAAPGKATVAVCVFAAISALFHLYVMRRGAFLAGHGRSLGDDFRAMPRLIAGFVLRPLAIFASMAERVARMAQSEAAL